MKVPTARDGGKRACRRGIRPLGAGDPPRPAAVSPGGGGEARRAGRWFKFLLGFLSYQRGAFPVGPLAPLSPNSPREINAERSKRAQKAQCPPRAASFFFFLRQCKIKTATIKFLKSCFPLWKKKIKNASSAVLEAAALKGPGPAAPSAARRTRIWAPRGGGWAAGAPRQAPNSCASPAGSWTAVHARRPGLHFCARP